MDSAAPQTLPRQRKRSLNDVRAVIPATCYEKSNTKAWLALAQGAVLYIAPLTLLVQTLNGERSSFSGWPWASPSLASSYLATTPPMAHSSTRNG